MAEKGAEGSPKDDLVEETKVQLEQSAGMEGSKSVNGSKDSGGNASPAESIMMTTSRLPLLNGGEPFEVDKIKGSTEKDGGTVLPQSSGAEEANTAGYLPRWGSSSVLNNDSDDAARSPSASDELSIGSGSSAESVPFVDDLPAFADASNKALHAETKRLDQLCEAAEKSSREHFDRVAIMEEHLKNVRQEVDHTNGLLAAQKKEIETEEHLLALSERESGRFQVEIKQAADDLLVGSDRSKNLQNQISSARDETDKLKLALNWNQEELEQWATAAAKKEEDNLALQKYTRADEMKIKELSLSIESLTKLSVAKQALLDNETTQTQACQTELDRIAENFRSQHGERRQLVKQWQETIETMRARDEEVRNLSTTYAETEQDLEKQLKLLAKNREVLALLEIDKDELNQSVEAAERGVQTKRQECLMHQQNKLSFLEELEALKVETAASENSLRKKQAEKSVTENELAERKVQLTCFKQRCDAIKLRLEEEKRVTSSRERAAIEVENLLAEREKELKEAERNAQSLKDNMFVDSHHLADLRKVEADLLVDIRSAKNASKNLSAKLQDLETRRSRQQELIYNAEFQLQQMERKVARGLGERSDEEKLQLQGRIAELERELRIKEEKCKALSKQRKKVYLELQSWKRRKESYDRQQADIQNQISEVEVEISSCELNLKHIVPSKEDAMVTHDIVRLDVRRLRDILRNRAEEVYSLEKKKDQLAFSVAEKKAEIKVREEVRTAQLRAFEEERHKSAVELAQRSLVAEKLRSKFEMLSKAHHTDGDNGGESQIFHLITAAQKREELQREGDELDRTIRQKEKETRAMEKTLSHLRERNTQFRLSFHKADMKSNEAKELKQLDEEAKKSEGQLFDLKKELQILQQQTAQLEAKKKSLIGAKGKVCKDMEHQS